MKNKNNFGSIIIALIAIIAFSAFVIQAGFNSEIKKNAIGIIGMASADETENSDTSNALSAVKVRQDEKSIADVFTYAGYGSGYTNYRARKAWYELNYKSNYGGKAQQNIQMLNDLKTGAKQLYQSLVDWDEEIFSEAEKYNQQSEYAEDYKESLARLGFSQEEAESRTNPVDVQVIQQKLWQAGMQEVGGADGKIGTKTAKAISDAASEAEINPYFYELLENAGLITSTQQDSSHTKKLDADKKNEELKKPDDEGSACEEKWKCSDWSNCIDGKQNRKCDDENECGTDENKPPEEKDCIAEDKKSEPEVKAKFGSIDVEERLNYVKVSGNIVGENLRYGFGEGELSIGFSIQRGGGGRSGLRELSGRDFTYKFDVADYQNKGGLLIMTLYLGDETIDSKEITFNSIDSEVSKKIASEEGEVGDTAENSIACSDSYKEEKYKDFDSYFNDLCSCLEKNTQTNVFSLEEEGRKKNVRIGFIEESPASFSSHYDEDIFFLHNIKNGQPSLISSEENEIKKEINSVMISDEYDNNPCDGFFKVISKFRSKNKKSSDVTEKSSDGTNERAAGATALSDTEDECVSLIIGNPSNNNPDNKLDVVFVGSGYHENEFDDLRQESLSYANELLKFEPFSSNKDKINFYYVRAYNDFGCGAGIDIYGRRGGGCNNVITSEETARHCKLYRPKVSPYLDNRYLRGTGQIPYEQYQMQADQIIIIENTNEFFGATALLGKKPYIMLNKGYPKTFVHEFGHGFGRLNDEYLYLFSGDSKDADKSMELYAPPTGPGANCATEPTCDKWKDLIGKEGVGCFQSCSYTNWYRPMEESKDSIMMYYTTSFNPVGERHLRRLMENYK